MKLFGRVDGQITKEDRPHWMGELFAEAGETPEPTPVAGAWTNILDRAATGWLNIGEGIEATRMRLFGVVDGAIDDNDRPHAFIECFTLSGTRKLGGWSNV